MEDQIIQMMYKTNSLSLASFLYSQPEIEFAGLNEENPEKIFFLFKPPIRAKKLADDFFGNKTKHPPQPLELFKNYNTLREMVFSIKRNLPPEKDKR